MLPTKIETNGSIPGKNPSGNEDQVARRPKATFGDQTTLNLKHDLQLRQDKTELLSTPESQIKPPGVGGWEEINPLDPETQLEQ